MRITIEDYDPVWNDIFIKEKKFIEKLLRDLNPSIEHIGSTSVPGLASKPIVDILIGLKSIVDLDKSVKKLLNYEYIYYKIYEKTFPERRFLIKLKDKKLLNNFKNIVKDEKENSIIEIKDRLCHLHIVKKDSEFWDRHIKFRDYLIKNKSSRDKYGKLKKELSKEEWEDGNEYAKAKNDFIKSIEELL